MAVKIRLQRGGRHKRPHYRIIVAEDNMKRDGRFIEALGTYDPLPKENEVKLDVDGYERWIKNGAQPTERVNFLYKEYKKKHKAA